MSLGLNGGYAYTFVWNESFSLSLASVFGASLTKHLLHSTSASTTFSNKFSYGLTNLSRISVGFNTNKYYLGFSYIGFFMDAHIGDPGDWSRYYTGNIRFNVVRRFQLKRSIKILRPDLWIL